MRGNKHTLLGIKIEIKDSPIQVDIVNQLDECIEMFDEDISTLVTFTTTMKSFEVREDAEQLSEKRDDCSTWWQQSYYLS